MLAFTLTFSRDQGDSVLLEAPASSAVFVLRGDGEPYISKTANLRRRLQRLLAPPTEHSRRLNLRDRVCQIEFTPTGSDFESQFLLYKLLRNSFPKTYAARLRLRPAPLIKLHLENEYPRASVTTRLGKLFTFLELGATKTHCHSERSSITSEVNDGTQSRNLLLDAGQQVSRLRKLDRCANQPASLEMTVQSGATNIYYGPFPSRAFAEKFASDALDFFKMRRCVDDLHPDPAFPGCVYSEMKMCLAPCFKGCTDDEYRAEVMRVQAFFETRGESLSRELADLRERASAALAFEEAATLHAKIEKLKPLVTQLPEIVRRIDQLDAIIIQPGAEPDVVSLFRFRDSQITGPIPFRIDVRGTAEGPAVDVIKAAKPPTLESRVEQAIHAFSKAERASATERIEHLAMLRRWYYRSRRAGEIFFADEKGDWPYRRIVRGIGRVHRGEKHEELVASPPAHESSPSS